MNNLDTIKRIFGLIAEKRLGAALSLFQNLLVDRIFVHLGDRYEKIQGDYDLLLNYMRQSYADPSREQLYNQLLAKLFRICADALLAWKVRNVQSYTLAAQRVERRPASSEADIRQALENYVADVAMLQLVENDTQRGLKEEELFKRHADFTDWLFDSILVGKAWNNDRALFYQNLILAPTVDTADAALIVAAVTLACMNIFDPLKWKTLTQVYRQHPDEKVRQRALVGWAMALPERLTDEGVRQSLAELLIDTDTCDDLFQLQRQVFLCMNAEKDTRQIPEDIMPGLIKNNHLNITRFGISEQEEDPLRDILDPNADDKAMEEVEESIHRMMDMQKAGADIYFGGFSQMKRFGFFYQTVNWFRIFDSRHPSLAHVRRKLNDTTLLDKLIEKGPFCDSDKFSFALGLASVLDRLPQEYRSMLGDAEMFGPVDQMEVMNSAAYIRRMYLQDLYRFFKLAEARKDFRNPFDSDNALFFAHEGVAALMPAERMAQLGAFLLKQQRYEALGQLLQWWPNDQTDNDSLMLRGAWLMHNKRFDEAADCLSQAAEGVPDDRGVLLSLAKAYYQAGRLEEAGAAYRRLMDLKPGHVPTVLYAAMCDIRTGQTKRAVDMLYQCFFENEKDRRVERVLAWALMADGQAQKAQKFYDALLAGGGKVNADDYLNAAYCKWALQQVPEAVELFRAYLNDTDGHHADGDNNLLFSALMDDRDILLRNGIPAVEIPIMADLATRRD